MSAAQLMEHTTRAQLQADVYRCVSALLAAEVRGRLGFRLPGLGPAAPEPSVAPAQYCLYETCPASTAPPLQLRRCVPALQLLSHTYWYAVQRCISSLVSWLESTLWCNATLHSYEIYSI